MERGQRLLVLVGSRIIRELVRLVRLQPDELELLVGREMNEPISSHTRMGIFSGNNVHCLCFQQISLRFAMNYVQFDVLARPAV